MSAGAKLCEWLVLAARLHSRSFALRLLGPAIRKIQAREQAAGEFSPGLSAAVDQLDALEEQAS